MNQKNNRIDLSNPTANLNKRMVSGFSWVTIERWTQRVLSLGVIAILARLLSKEDFGLVAAAAILVDYFSTFVGQGLGLAVIQHDKLEAEHLNAMFWLNMAFAIPLTAIAFVFAPYLSGWIHSPNAAPVVRWLAIGLVLQAFGRVQVALLTRQMRFQVIAFVNVLGSLAGAVAGVTMAFMGLGVWSLVGQQLVASCFRISILFWVTKWRPGIDVSKRHIRELYGFSIFVFLDQQVLFIYRRMDEALVAAFSGVTGLGLYSVAKRIVLMLQDSLEGPLGMVFISAFSRLQGSHQQLKETAETSFRMSSLLVFPCFLGLTALAPEAVGIIFGPKWVDAIPYVQILAIASMIIVFHLVIHSIFLAVGRPLLNLVVNSGRAVLSLVLLPIGAIFGGLGIPTAVAIRNMIAAALDVFIFKKKVKEVPVRFLGNIYCPLVASAIMACTARMAANLISDWNMPAAAILGTVTGIGTYALLIFVLDRELFSKSIASFKEICLPGYIKLRRLFIHT